MEEQKELELRMYALVAGSISDIQKAIQAGHAAQQYDHVYKDDPQLIDFIENHKTWIILNGGTTNSHRELGTGVVKGTLNKIEDDIDRYNMVNQKPQRVKFASFTEPDLNDALTAVCFICDERVFNYEDYPDIDKYAKEHMDKMTWIELFRNGPVTYDQVEERVPLVYEKWVRSLGGSKNVFLRELLKGKKLA